MVKITGYQAQRGITPAGTGVRLRPGSLSSTGAAVRGLGDAAMNATQAIVQRQKYADDTAWASKVSAAGVKDWSQKLVDAKQSAVEGADGFAPQVDKDFAAYRTAVLKDAPSPEAANLAGRRFDRLSQSVFNDALSFEASAKRSQRLTDFGLSVKDLATSAYADPSKVGEYIKQAEEDLKTASETWMLPQDASAQRKTISASLAEAALRGQIQATPEAVLKALEGKGDPTVARLDTSRRTVLASSARAEINRRAYAHNQARQGLTNRLKELDGVVSAGFNPGDGAIEALQTDILKFNDPQLAGAVTSLQNDLGFQTEIRGWTPTQLQGWVNSARGQLQKSDGVSGAQANRVGLAEKVLSSMRAGVQQDPLSWASRAGVAEVQPISFSGQDAVNSMKSRRDTAGQVANHFGISPRFLTDEEENQLKSDLEGASADKQVAIAFALNEGFGPDAASIFKRIAPGDPLFAHAGGLASLGTAQAGTARDVLAGRDVLKAGNKVLPAPLDMNEWTADELAGALSETPATRGAVVEAAKAIYASTALRRGITPVDADEGLWRQSLQRAAGGVLDANGDMRGGIGQWNDKSVLLPSGVLQADFEKMLGATLDADLVNLGHPVHGDGTPLKAEDLQDARLVDYGHGQYLVDMSGDGVGFVRGDGPNGYFVLDVAQLGQVMLARNGSGVEVTALGNGDGTP